MVSLFYAEIQDIITNTELETPMLWRLGEEYHGWGMKINTENPIICK